MQFVREIIGGVLIIAVSGLIGIAQNTVREDSLALVPKASHAETKKSAAPQVIVTDNVNTSNHANGHAASREETASGGPTEAELATGELTMDRLRFFMESGDAIVVDARSVAEYDAGRIAGAVNIPYDELIDYYEKLKSTLPLDALIVCYCESVTCDNSENLAKELGFMGYSNVFVYRGGWQEWEAAGHPVEKPSGN